MIGAAVCGGSAVVALFVFVGGNSAAQEALVIAASALAGLVLLPLLAFIWEFIWAPWKAIRERVDRLDRSMRAEDKPEAKRKGLSVARRVYRTTRDELAGTLRRFERESHETEEEGRNFLSWDIGGRPLGVAVWRAYRDAFTSLPDQDLYEKVRDAYELVERLNRCADGAAERLGLGGFVSGSDGLDDLPSTLQIAVDALEQSLEQIETATNAPGESAVDGAATEAG